MTFLQIISFIIISWSLTSLGWDIQEKDKLGEKNIYVCIVSKKFEQILIH